MIDLHMHTTYSDGQYTTKELLEMCQKIGLDIISITDHDSVDASIILPWFNKNS